MHYVRLPLQTAYNVRDLGGYACSDGGATRWRAFVRGDDLAPLSPADIDFLLGYGVRTVIDLRGGQECRERPNPFADREGVAYIHQPLGLDKVEDISRFVTDEPEKALINFYKGIIATRGADLKQILDVMAQAQPGAVLYHCMVGKDRTGIVSALLLGLAGVSAADIVSNYMVTYEYVRRNPFVQQVMTAYSPELFHSPAHSMEMLLAFIDSEYGSMRRYFDSIGVTAETLHALRERLCAPGVLPASARG